VGKEIVTQYLQEEIFAWENIAKKTSLKHAELSLAEISPHPPKKALRDQQDVFTF